MPCNDFEEGEMGSCARDSKSPLEAGTGQIMFSLESPWKGPAATLAAGDSSCTSDIHRI